MSADRMNEPQSEGIEQIQDLPVQPETAEQVKGGFDPQPDPPKTFIPPFQPPIIIKPVIIR